jgi:hypothetical protein
VLGGVADDADKKYANEQTAQPKSFRRRFDRADQDLAHPGDRRRQSENGEAFGYRPLRSPMPLGRDCLTRTLKELPMGNQRKH